VVWPILILATVFWKYERSRVGLNHRRWKGCVHIIEKSLDYSCFISKWMLQCFTMGLGPFCMAYLPVASRLFAKEGDFKAKYI